MTRMNYLRLRHIHQTENAIIMVMLTMKYGSVILVQRCLPIFFNFIQFCTGVINDPAGVLYPTLIARFNGTHDESPHRIDHKVWISVFRWVYHLRIFSKIHHDNNKVPLHWRLNLLLHQNKKPPFHLQDCSVHSIVFLFLDSNLLCLL